MPPSSEAALEALVGEYQLAPTFSIAITRDGNQLFEQATAQPRFPISPESETPFVLNVADAQLTFEKDGSGKATRLVLHQGGRDTPGVKTK